jgi:N-hydroxyarylamine O-acetyltransferase
MNINTYLERINYNGKLDMTIESLRELQLAHLFSIPFENLSIHLNKPILLDYELLFDKIVLRKLGGFCYELNGLFAYLLERLGFDVTILSASVASTENGFGPEFDHMTLMVSLEKKWLVDVGFGDSFREPLLIETREPQFQANREYLIKEVDQYLVLYQRENDGRWKSQYRFTTQPRKLKDFVQMCNYHQTSPESHFTQKRLCTIAKSNGRVTLSGVCLIETTDDRRKERNINNDTEYEAVLENEFGIKINNYKTDSRVKFQEERISEQ